MTIWQIYLINYNNSQKYIIYFAIQILFNTFAQNLRIQINFVNKMYRSRIMLGIVTMEDVIETMLGVEIVDENDIAEDMQLLAEMKD